MVIRFRRLPRSASLVAHRPARRGRTGVWPGLLLAGWLALGWGAAPALAGVRVAAIASLTGPAADTNAPVLVGARWAVEEINAAGGVLGQPLEWIEIDTRSTPIGAKVAAEEAVRRGAAAIVGPAFSSQAMAAARVAQAQGIPMIADLATHPAVTRIGDCIFRAGYTDDLQGRALAAFARQDLQARTAVVLCDLVSDYGIGLSEAFARAFESLGGRVLERIAYKPRQPHFRDEVARAGALDPDVLFVPGYDESARIVAEASRAGLRAVPLGGDGWDTESFRRLGGDRIARGYYTTHWNSGLATPASRAFVARYGSRAELIAPMAMGYDAVHLLTDALRRAGSDHRPAIRDALAATRDFEGVTGGFAFNAHGDPLKSLVIMAIDRGQTQFRLQLRPAEEPTQP